MACQSQSADWSSPSIDVERCSPNPNASTPAAPTDFGTVRCEPVSVKCSSASGIIHLDKLKLSSADNKGGIKCILCDSAWYTPVELESLEGKRKSRNWRRSIYYHNTPLGTHLSSLGLITNKSGSASPRTLSPSRTKLFHQSSNNVIIDPVLVFVKAYRLKGNTVGLKQAVLSHFDPSCLNNAHKLLWNTNGDILEQMGLPYHARRGSDKCQVSDVLLADIVTAFDKLDACDKLPNIYCEAFDLTKIPCLVPDIVSKRVADNTSSLESLTNAVQNLPSKLSTTLFEPVTKCCDGLNELIFSVKTQLDHLSASVKSFSHSVVVSSPPSLVRSVQNTSSLPRPSHSTMDHKSHTQYDRSLNVILFGLPESNLLDTKSTIDQLSIFLVGKAIKLVDAFCLGCRPESKASPSARPRPLLIKLESTWDKKLPLASSRKLKGYTISRLFLREDLPPEARSAKTKRQTEAAPLLSSVSPGPLTKNSPATDDADGTVVCSDAVSGDTTLLVCLENGAINYLPKVRSNLPAVPGWNRLARSHRNSANFWHKL